jgi:probable rRNA maturation factor
MISYNYETEFKLSDKKKFTFWLSSVIHSEGKKEGDINFVFCNDEYLFNLNKQYLDHDTLTDIITFDYSVGNELHGDVFISVERVRDNAVDFKVSFEEELKRVMVHGILHLCGYKDKSTEEEKRMREKEDEKMLLFHVEHN